MKRFYNYIFISLIVMLTSACAEDYDPESPLIPSLSASYTSPTDKEFNTTITPYPGDTDLDNNSETENNDANLDINKEDYNNDTDLNHNGESGGEINKTDYPQDNDLD